MLALLVAIAAPCMVAAESSCPQFSPSGRLPALLNPKLKQRVTVLCNEGYAVAASGITHGALWSAEHLTAANVTSARETLRVGLFHSEDRLPYDNQAHLGDYRGSGYDRGHMAPSGDMPNLAAQRKASPWPMWCRRLRP